MNISIVIPNYNGANLLKKNLPKVFEAAEYYLNKQNIQVEIVVVDDCSTDNSVEEVKNSKLKVKSNNLKLKIIKNDRNLGFSSTVNKGVEESMGEIVVLLNTDVVPEKEFLIPLVSRFKEEDLFAVGCMDKSIENKKVVFRGRGIGKWEKGFLVHSAGEVGKTDTLWVAGGSGAFRKSIWQKLGGFNPLYNPFYWEDIDLSYRALKSGYKILFAPKAKVTHQHEVGAIKKMYSPLQVKKIAYRNQFMFVWMNVSDTDILLSHILWLPYRFFKMLVLRDWAFYIGFIKAFKSFYKVLLARKVIQKEVKIGDREVTSQFRT